MLYDIDGVISHVSIRLCNRCSNSRVIDTKNEIVKSSTRHGYDAPRGRVCE